MKKIEKIDAINFPDWELAALTDWAKDLPDRVLATPENMFFLMEAYNEMAESLNGLIEHLGLDKPGDV